MKEKKASIGSILLDTGNPRIDPVGSQHEAIEAMLRQCGQKVLKLAADIIRYGTNPTDIPSCIEERLPGGKVVYIAKEGNRRLLALKALLRPTIIDNALWRSKFQRLIRVSGGIGFTPRKIKIAVFTDAEEDYLKHWITIKHDGENGGAGTVTWGSEESSRFSGSGRNDLAVAVKRWLKGQSVFSADEKQMIDRAPITTLERILAFAQGRDILGVSFEDRRLHAIRKVENVRNNLMHVVRDLATPDPRNPRRMKINVSDVKNANQILNYLRPLERSDDRLGETILLTCDMNTGGVGNSQDSTDGDVHTNRGGGRLTVASHAYLRAKLRELSASSGNAKLKKLIAEMTLMSLEKMPLAFCIVFRSLLDISMHGYAHRNGIVAEGVSYKNLAKKCKDELLSTNLAWNNGEPKRLINDAFHVLNTETLFSITELNNLVHGRMTVPSSDVVLSYAPRIIPFLIALNGGAPPAEV